MSKTKNRAVVRGVCAGFCLLAVLSARGEQYRDDFSNGVNTCWWESSNNQPLYQVTTTNGGISFAKPIGSDTGFQWVDLHLLRELHGDFDVSATFANASIHHATGWPGNQIQLNLFMGTNVFAVVRSDENDLGGENAHVWSVPPSGSSGIAGAMLKTSASGGTLRAVRSGNTISGYFNGTQLWSGAFGTGAVQLLSFSLQNNGTRDATFVTLDSFSVEAQDIRPLPCRISGFATAKDGTVSVLITNVTPFLTNTLQESTDLTTNVWVSLSQAVTSNTDLSLSQAVTNSRQARFYRVTVEDNY